MWELFFFALRILRETERLVKNDYSGSNFSGWRLLGAIFAGLRCHLVVENVKCAEHTGSPIVSQIFQV